MSKKCINLRGLLTPLRLPKRIWSRTSCRSSETKLCTMNAAKTLREMGYTFNDEGKLKRLDENGEVTDEGYIFEVSNNHRECQTHYDRLGKVIIEYVYQLMEELGLKRLPVPKELSKGTFIFGSEDYDKKENLCILINGSGVVRAGQWARSLIINESLHVGSQIAHIKCALARDFGVIVLNPNDNYLPNGQNIPHSGTAEEHTKYVWYNYIANTNATSIAFIAHSFGGVLAVALALKEHDEFEKRVKAIALTDSVHVYANLKITNYLKAVSRNWISSQLTLDQPLTTPDFDIERVSAGCERHELTSYSCMDSVFNFIDEKIPTKS